MPQTVGKVLKKMRLDRGLTQGQIEYRTKGQVKRDWLASVENGRIKHPPPDKLEFLAEVFGTSMLEIYRQAGFVKVPYPGGASPQEEKLIADFRSLSSDQKQIVLNLTRDLRRASEAEIEESPRSE